jgi:hypothetical protein
MGDHVDARPHRHRVAVRLQHRLAAREEASRCVRAARVVVTSVPGTKQ